MITDLSACIAEAVANPRGSLRRFAGKGPHSLGVLAALLIAAYTIQAMAAVAIPGGRAVLEGPVVNWHLAGLFQQIVLSGVMAGLIYAAGRLFGGEGEPRACIEGVLWYNFVTAFLTPFLLIGMTAMARGDAGAGSFLLLLGSAGIAIWVFAGTVAEIHAFRSLAVVVAATIGFLVMTGMMLVSITSGA